MSRTGLNVRLKGRRRRIRRLNACGNIGRCAVWQLAVAVSTTEWYIVLASDNEHRASKRARARCATNGEQFADGDGLFGRFAGECDADIVVARKKESVLERCQIRGDHVSRRVVVLVDGLIVACDEIQNFGCGYLIPDGLGSEVNADSLEVCLQAGNEVGVELVLGRELANPRVGRIAETEWLVQARAVKIPTSDNVWEELRSNRKPSQDHAVGVVWIERREPVRLYRTERVADVDDSVIGLADLWNSAVAKFRGYCVESLYFGLRLDLVEGIAMGRIADAQAIDSQCTVSSFKCSVDITVVVVVV